MNKKAANNKTFRVAWAIIFVVLILNFIMQTAFDIELYFLAPPKFLLLLAVLIWIPSLYFTNLKKRKHSENPYSIVQKFGLFTCCLILEIFVFVSIYITIFTGPSYTAVCEPQTQRNFVVKSISGFKGGEWAMLYEQKGLFLVPCDVQEHRGDFIEETPKAYISEDGQHIVVACFLCLLFFQSLFSSILSR